MTPTERRIKECGGIRTTEEGWVVEKSLDLYDLNITVLPKIKSVGGDFHCNFNRLANLAGSPKLVGKDFDCGHNKLTNLTGSPRFVGKNFWCHDNPLKSLSGLPDKIGGNFGCDDGLSFPKEEIILLIKARPRNLKEIIKRIKWI